MRDLIICLISCLRMKFIDELKVGQTIVLSNDKTLIMFLSFNK